jgi:hypothetical protein
LPLSSCEFLLIAALFSPRNINTVKYHGFGCSSTI